MNPSSPTPKVGAIIRKDNSVLLLYRAKQNDWTFPKGHVEPGKSNHQAMIREIKEETGLDVKIIRELSELEYATGKGEGVNVTMFLAEPIDPNQPTKPEHEGDKLEWIPGNDVNSRLSYENLKTYFDSIRNTI